MEEKPRKIMFSAVMKKNGEGEASSKFVPKKIEMNFPAKTVSFRKNKKREGKANLNLSQNEFSKQNGLPLRHYYQ